MALGWYYVTVLVDGYDSFLNTDNQGLCSGVGIQFPKDGRNMVLDSMLADPQFIGYLFIHVPVGS